MSNPLQKYFRQPSIYIPIDATHWPPDTIELDANGQVAVYPMTAKDELYSKTPDALMSGTSTANIIASCIPQIKDPWSIPAVDIDNILISIRIASYGQEMEFKSKCPECNEEEPYSLDLTVIMDSLPKANYSDPLVTDTMTIWFKPITYKEQSDMAQQGYQEQRIMMTINAEGIDDAERQRQFTQLFKDLVDMTEKGVASNIKSVEVDGQVVTQPAFIQEFIANCPKNIYEQIKEKITDLQRQASVPPQDIVCPSCSKQYQAPLEFDPSTFFG